MPGAGGWPMSVFLTPDLQPFFSGTYFPPVPRYNMPSFKDLLAGIARTWQEQQDEATRVGNDVSSHLQQTLSNAIQADAGFTQVHLDAAVKSLLDSYDWGYGGWGSSPTFPEPLALGFMFRRYTLGVAADDTLNPAIHALQAMARGGMY